MNKKILKLFLLIIFLASFYITTGQQPQVYDQFFMNPYVYNPAYAGVEGHAAMFLTYRNQWVDINGSPTTAHASFHVPFRKGIAIGASAFSFRQGLLNTAAAKITGSYLLTFDRTHFLRFGLSIGSGINSVNITEFDAPNDPAFLNFLDQSSFFIGDFGMTYHFGHFNIGFSLPNLFEYSSVSQESIAPIKFSPTDVIIMKTNYRGHIGNNFAIEPHILYRYSSVFPNQYEAAVIGHIYHIVWVGLGYRQDVGLIGLAGAKIKEKLGIGVAFENGTNETSALLGPTIEVTIGYHLSSKKEHADHISSFIKSHRLSAEERAALAEIEKEKELASQQAIEDSIAATSQPELKTEPVPVYTDLEPETNDEPIIEQPKTNDEPIIEQPEPIATEEVIEEGQPVNLSVPVVRRRGTHLLELPIGNFVIVGAFSEFRNAEKYSDLLFERGYRDVRIGYLTSTNYYYVVIDESIDISQAQYRASEFRKIPEFSRAWTLVIQE